MLKIVFVVVLVGVLGNVCHSNMIASNRVVLFSLHLHQVWYLIVSIPDLCNLTYFHRTVHIHYNSIPFPRATDIINVRTISVPTDANSIRSKKKTHASFSCTARYKG